MIDLIIGDIYYSRERSITNNRDTKEIKESFKDVFVRGKKHLYDNDNNLTMICDDILHPEKSTRRIWNNPEYPKWIHIGPGEINDYPEYLL